MQKRKILFIALAGLFLAGISIGLYQLIKQLGEYHSGEEAYLALEQFVALAEPAVSEDTVARQWPQIDFAQLQDINNNFAGWLYGAGTGLNYPVVKGDDNSYYLNHLFDGSSNSAGCLFLDYRLADDFSDRHLIIYGHHMKNGTMLSAITNYSGQEYYEEHPVLFLLTPAATYRIDLFSGYVAATDSEAWRLRFDSHEDYQAWLKQLKATSLFDSEVNPAPTEQIITLSTCSYEFDNARFVLHGVLRQLD